MKHSIVLTENRDITSLQQPAIFLDRDGVVIKEKHYLSNPNNDWRKPLPGMILQAAQEFNIDLKSSILIGDKVSDLIAGARAGIKDLIHLRTGHGSAETAYINLESHHRETPCKGTVNADLQDFTVSCYKDIPSLHSYII